MKHIGIFSFNDMELMDFAGPYEVFTAVNEVSEFTHCRVYTISETGSTIKTINGLQVLSDFSTDNCPQPDILIIPGGNGTRQLVNNLSIIQWIKKSAEKAEIVFSVCSGARLLAKAGLLDGLEFTTHHLVYEDVAQLAPSAKLKKERRFTDNGNVMTAGGITAGIDLSLYIIEKLFGQPTARKVKVYMEYGNWR
jgi:transcriptional regulator GlxA family with amidase domain